MDDNVNFRSFKEGDYETCCKWWKWWWKHHEGDPPPKALLPQDKRCFIIEKNNTLVACYFLFIMEPMTVGWATYLVSNPEYKEKDRRDLIKLLIQNVEKEAEKYGIMQLFTVCGDKHMSNIHDSLDWIMIPVEYEGFKYLTNNFRKQ